MSCPHRWFLDSWRANERSLSERFEDWKVYCGRCGLAIGGCGDMAKAQRIVWRNDQKTWFGSFGIVSC